jgi:hypothetical protein
MILSSCPQKLQQLRTLPPQLFWTHVPPGRLPRAGAYRVYRYVPTAGCAIGGTVANIGLSPAYSFISDGGSGRNSTAHEFGHCLGPKHPPDSTSTGQFTAHMRATLSIAVPA